MYSDAESICRSVRLKLISGNAVEGAEIVRRHAHALSNTLQHALFSAEVLALSGDGIGAEACLDAAMSKFRDPADLAETATRKLEILIESGKTEEAMKWALDPRGAIPGEEFIRLRIDVLEAAGMAGRAMEECRVILEKNQADPWARERLGQLKTCEQADFSSISGHGRGFDRENAASLILRLFKGREGVFARMTRSENGNWGYSPVKRNLDREVVLNHLVGSITAGVYQLAQDGTVWFMAFDIDLKKSHLRAFEENPMERGALEADLQSVSSEILGRIKKSGLTALSENSGRKGYHLWTFFDEPFPAKVVRSFAGRLIDGIELPQGIGVEVFPKQDSVREGGLGNLIKLPLGLHRKSGNWSRFVDSNFKVFPDQVKALENVVVHTRENFLDALGKVSGCPAGSDPPRKTAGPEDETHSCTGINSDPRLAAEPVVSEILGGCGVMAALVEKAIAVHSLEHMEKHVLIYIMSLAGPEARACLHRVLSRTIDYEPGAVEDYIRSVPPNPMSCPKIRKHLRTIADAVGCRCRFVIPEGSYPSPLVYAGILPRTGRSAGPMTGSGDGPAVACMAPSLPNGLESIDALMSRYLILLKQIEIQSGILKRISASVKARFEGCGSRLIETSLGFYEMIVSPSGEIEFKASQDTEGN